MNGDSKLNYETLENTSKDTLHKVNLHKLFYDVHVEGYLNLSKDQMVGMSAEECGMAAYTLTQYSSYLQLEQNKYSNIAKWAIRNINALLAKEYNNLGDKYTKYEMRRHLLIQNNSYASEMYEKFLDAKVRFNTLRGIGKTISYIARTLSDLQQTKRYQK